MSNQYKGSGIINATALALGMLLASGECHAQGSANVPNNAMQGFSQNRDQPIKIEADLLELRQKKKEATFSGGVKVIQGDTAMTSQTLAVFYESGGDKSPPPGAKGAKVSSMQSVTPGPGGGSSIRRLEARGHVVVTQKDQVVTGETAVFDTKANLITMLGGGSGYVVLTQCKNVMRGDRLKVDMTTGVSRVESDTGRVQVLLPQGAGHDCGSGSPAMPEAVAPPQMSGGRKSKLQK